MHTVEWLLMMGLNAMHAMMEANAAACLIENQITGVFTRDRQVLIRMSILMDGGIAF